MVDTDSDWNSSEEHNEVNVEWIYLINRVMNTYLSKKEARMREKPQLSTELGFIFSICGTACRKARMRAKLTLSIKFEWSKKAFKSSLMYRITEQMNRKW